MLIYFPRAATGQDETERPVPSRGLRESAAAASCAGEDDL